MGKNQAHYLSGGEHMAVAVALGIIGALVIVALVAILFM